ncbi:MAG TPA: helix-turn-helix transcriptional regulator [Waterburya sp.]|jgi:transcriptional regulator with XRE-family HTH domain
MRRKLREAFFLAVKESKLSGKKLAELSGLSESQLSEFRNGKREITLGNFEQVVNSLPPDVYHRFCCQLTVTQMDQEQLCELIAVAAFELKSKQALGTEYSGSEKEYENQAATVL